MAKQKFTLKQWRQIRELTQLQLGAQVGVTRQTVAAWETYGAPTDPEMIEKLEQALNINWKSDVNVQ